MYATFMRRSLTLTVLLASSAIAMRAFLPDPAVAQLNPSLPNVPDAMAQTIRAKITRIDTQQRKLTLEGADGRSVTVTAGPLVRLEMLKVGDTVTATYYRSVAFEFSKQMANVPPNAEVVAVEQRAQAPGGVAVGMMRISGLVVGRSGNSLDVVNPTGGGVYTIHVTDPARIAMLPEIKVGDVITAIVSDTLAVSVE